ncbi:MAG TPA: hypothetical protein DCS33_04725 [Gammaproteobacteria bacterium]|nr:hypothetical protein [Gammaproteobacteria bacterium]
MSSGYEYVLNGSLIGSAKLISKFTRFIIDIVLPDKVDKERPGKILSEGIIETWKNEEQARRAKEAREIAKETYKKIRSSWTDEDKE